MQWYIINSRLSSGALLVMVAERRDDLPVAVAMVTTLTADNKSPPRTIIRHVMEIRGECEDDIETSINQSTRAKEVSVCTDGLIFC